MNAPDARATPEMENPGALAGATGADQVSTKDAQVYRAPVYSTSPAWTGADWARDRWAWKRAVKSDRRLSDAAKLLATSLVDDFAHHASAACTPGVELLGRCLAWSERKVMYALAELRKAGWIAVENGRGRGVRSRILFRTGDGTVPVEASPKVVDLAARRAEAAQPQVEEKVQDPAPFPPQKVQEQEVEKVQDRAEKGARSCTPYKEPKIEPIRAHARDPSAPEAEQPPPLRPLGAATPPLREVTPGSAMERAWDDWLRRRGLPDLSDLGHTNGKEGRARHYLLPSLFPPLANDPRAEAEALRFCRWLAEKRRERMRQAEGGPAAPVEGAA